MDLTSPAKSGLHRTPGQFLDEGAQGEQILDTEQRSAGRHGHEWIGIFDVGPAGGQRAEALVTGFVEKHPVLAPGVGEAGELVFPAIQRMERVGDTESLLVAAAMSS